MYETYYGLQAKPFELHPDPDFVYMSHGHDRVFTHLEYATREAKGLAVITGEIGSGKTTLINLLMRRVPENADVALISNTMVPPTQLLKLICKEFGLAVKGKDKADLLEAFGQYLRRQHLEGRRVILIVDEAQNLPPRTIEEIRLLSNLEADKQHLLQILLVGQPELRAKLRKEEMKQVLQRVTVHCHLGPLNREELERYIRHRLGVAGARSAVLFDDSAVDAVHQYSGGIPRLVNILCDTALVFGFGEDRPVIDRSLIDDVIEARQAGSLFEVEQKQEKRRSRPAQPSARKSEIEELVHSLAQRVRDLEAAAEAARSERQTPRAWADLMDQSTNPTCQTDSLEDVIEQADALLGCVEQVGNPAVHSIALPASSPGVSASSPARVGVLHSLLSWKRRARSPD